MGGELPKEFRFFFHDQYISQNLIQIPGETAHKQYAESKAMNIHPSIMQGRYQENAIELLYLLYKCDKRSLNTSLYFFICIRDVAQ